MIQLDTEGGEEILPSTRIRRYDEEDENALDHQPQTTDTDPRSIEVHDEDELTNDSTILHEIT
jgi:hypothetical protein